jgi:hypothetical protein
VKIKGQPIEALVRDLNNDAIYGSPQWQETSMTLGEFGTNAAPAIPDLCRVLATHHDPIAANAIGMIHTDAEIAVPALLNALKAVQLGSMGNKWLINLARRAGVAIFLRTRANRRRIRFAVANVSQPVKKLNASP